MKTELRLQIEKLVSELRRRRLSLGFGESCTGGLLSGTVAGIAGVSDVFMGSVVSYSYNAKVDLLGVSWDTLNNQGAVSEDVARQMSRGVCERLKVNCSAAITGVAGPSGGTPDKPVGTVWFAVRGPRFESAEKKVFSGDREAIQMQSVEFAVGFLLRELSKTDS
ncbi:MAG: CinA family protein [Bdellovibrio sp.]